MSERQSDPERNDREATVEEVEEPAKIVRVATMTATLLEEMHRCPLDEQGRQRLHSLYETAVGEIGGVVSDDLRQELDRMRPAIGDGAGSESELRVAHAQLAGWLEGLVQGMQAPVDAQQMVAQNQLEQLHRQARAEQHQEALRPSRDTSYL